MKRILPLALFFLALGAAAPVAAETLLIQRVQAAGDVVLPKRGASMAAVEAAFGVPPRKHPPVGGGDSRTPPITRWDYPEFSVYFENEHVVNSVLLKASELEIGPGPGAGLNRRMATESRFPAEWEPQSGVILIAWPHAGTDWARAPGRGRGDLRRAGRGHRPLRAGADLRGRRRRSRRAPQRACAGRVDLARRAFRAAAVRRHLAARLRARSRCATGDGFRLLDFRFTGWGGKFEAGLDDQLVGALRAHGAVRITQSRAHRFRARRRRHRDRRRRHAADAPGAACTSAIPDARATN